ncbi:N-6 DNA methylase [Streptomyces microflavus]|uniref:N-6 DNA methylase n=1 Tax=Streptomyces microflavus TaxID=1919 RepID=UPI003411546F
MTSDAVVTAAEIARIAGVGPAAVSNWRKRHPDFPAPAAGTASSPQFLLDEVVAWLDRHGRSFTISPVDVLWRRMSALRDPARPAAVLAAAGALLAGERTGEGEQGPGLPGDVAGQVTRLGRQLGESTVFEALLERWAEAHARQVEVTPQPVAALMAEMVTAARGAAPQTVLDPACGTGGLLVEMAGAALLLAQDIDPDLAEVTRLRLGLRAKGQTATEAGDSLLGDAFTGRHVQAVVCNPPFGQRSWGRRELGYDARWVYGLPPNAEPELAWLQHALSHLDDDGFAAVLMPAAAAVRPAGKRVRAELVRQGALRAVVALPSGAAAGHGQGAHLWLAASPDERTMPPRILLVDTERLPGHPGESASSSTDWGSVHAAVASLWRGFLKGAENDSDACRTLPAHDLLDGEVDLTPARHLEADDDRDLELRRIEDHRAGFRKELDLVVAGPPPVEEALEGDRPTVFASLDDLISTGAVRMWRGASRSDSLQKRGQERMVVTMQQGLSRTPPTERVPVLSDDEIEEGDVLVFAAGPEGARPADPAEYGAVPGVGVTVLRPNPGVIDSWFLAGTLAYGPHRQRSTTPSGSRTRIDGSRLYVPVKELTEQQRIGESFRALARFHESLDRLAEEGRGMARRLAGALAAGSVRPVE